MVTDGEGERERERKKNEIKIQRERERERSEREKDHESQRQPTGAPFCLPLCPAPSSSSPSSSLRVYWCPTVSLSRTLEFNVNGTTPMEQPRKNRLRKRENLQKGAPVFSENDAFHTKTLKTRSLRLTRTNPFMSCHSHIGFREDGSWHTKMS